MSLIVGTETSIQMALPPTRLNKLQSILVAAEVTCSSGDFPVVTVEATLAAVPGLATAAVLAAVPAVLAVAVLAVPIVANGAAQALSSRVIKKRQPNLKLERQKNLGLLSATRNVEYPRNPRPIFYCFKRAIRCFYSFKNKRLWDNSGRNLNIFSVSCWK